MRIVWGQGRSWGQQSEDDADPPPVTDGDMSLEMVQALHGSPHQGCHLLDKHVQVTLRWLVDRHIVKLVGEAINNHSTNQPVHQPKGLPLWTYVGYEPNMRLWAKDTEFLICYHTRLTLQFCSVQSCDKTGIFLSSLRHHQMLSLGRWLRTFVSFYGNLKIMCDRPKCLIIKYSQLTDYSLNLIYMTHICVCVCVR